MGTGLERYIDGRTGRALRRLFKGDPLGMRPAASGGRASADYPATGGEDDTADVWIGRGPAPRVFSKSDCFAHPSAIISQYGAALRAVCTAPGPPSSGLPFPPGPFSGRRRSG